jgi:rsbT co-antagonist protein RsbR
MAASTDSRIPGVLSERQQEVLEEWSREQLTASRREHLISEGELKQQSSQLLRRFERAVQSGDLEEMEAPEWEDVRSLLAEFSRNRALQGFSPTEVANFVLSLKRPLFDAIKESLDGDSEQFAAEVWRVTRLLDRLGLYTMEIYQKSREEIIQRQHQELLELSTPVVKLWEDVVAVPLIGTLDSARTQVVMENLLQKIVDTGARIAIVDITGVPTVDTLVAQHLIKTVAAARLMGADCIISGIRPQIAQTIVHLGVDLGDVTTKATLADAISVALRHTGFQVTRLARAEH